MKSLANVSLLLAFLAALLWPATTTAQEKPYDSKALQAILIDARTGAVMFEKDADTAVPPASISKLMTMIMVFEALKANKITLDTEITISENAWRNGGSLSGRLDHVCRGKFPGEAR